MSTANPSIHALSLAALKPQVVLAMKAGLVPMIWGSPAIGKSSLVHQIAKEFNLMVLDLRLAQCDPVDLLGFPQIDGKGRAHYAPMETFPLEGDKIPDGYRGWLLFLDEMPNAPPAIQNAAYKLVLDRMVGLRKLHPKVAMMAAGNREGEGCMVEVMSEALKTRMVHFNAEVSTKDWLAWAIDNGMDHRIVSFINYRPDYLYTFNPDGADQTYASPRTWDFANRLIQANHGVVDNDIQPSLAGVLSFGIANEFKVFTAIYSKMVSIAEITADPDNARVPHEPAVLFALTGMLSYQMDADNGDDLIRYIQRLPVEFQVVTLRQAIKKNSEVRGIKAVQDWIVKNAHELFG